MRTSHEDARIGKEAVDFRLRSEVSVVRRYGTDVTEGNVIDMGVIGKVDSLWRYPVKSMRGEELDEAFMGFSGFYGDRIFAFHSSSTPKGFPFLTGREEQEMLRYRPRFRNPEKAARPPNLTEAESIGPGATPVFADAADLIVDVETPSGIVLAVDDPALLEMLDVRNSHALTLLRSERAMTDCRPVSLFGIQTARQLGDELGDDVDKRRFRGNVYVDFGSGEGFVEDGLVGRAIRIGSKARIAILERDSRCKMISLDPDTGESNPEILRKVARAHDGMAGVYGAVLVEGAIRKGDDVEVLD